MSLPAETSRWFLRLNPSPAPGLRLFCFPYAGGSAQVFSRWPRRLPAGVEVCVAALPGRGSRLREPPPTRLSSVVEQLAASAAPLLDRPFAFYGHSLGGLTGFELARTLRRAGLREPAHLFVSGCRPPHLRRAAVQRHRLPDAALHGELRRLNGTPPEVLESPELMSMMLPWLRADFEMLETYSYVEEAPLACPVSAFGGEDDPEVGADELGEWRRHTASGFSMRTFEGDHFFIRRQEPALLRALTRALADAAAI